MKGGSIKSTGEDIVNTLFGGQPKTR